MSDENPVVEKHWYALRDLKRSNALLPAYKQLSQLGIEIFTPMRWRMSIKGGKKIRQEIPVIQDLLFAYDTRQALDPIIAKTSTLQYRYKKGGKYCEPIIVSEEDMNRFINAVRATDNPKFYSVEELNTIKRGQNIRIVGGQLDGQEGKLLSVKGSKYKRLVIELSNLLAVSVEIQDEYIQVI